MAEQGKRTEALSVSAAMAMAKGALESISVRIIGEVSELSMNPRYKAVYFTIKDGSSSLPCMIWSNRYANCGVDLRIGALVEVSGRFSLYAAKGRMNFDVRSIVLAGEGDLRLKVAALAKKLEAEGLMDAARKRRIPFAPQTIGIVTSPRGAAVFDVLRTLRRRFPLADILFAGVTVEGRDAPRQIIEGLDALEASGAEVVLLVRGGGSFEDLMPFNDEALARRIASMSIPVITGIGHEPDNSIADMVSDLRASTPTAAAEAAVPSSIELESLLMASQGRLDSSMTGIIDASSRRLERSASSPSLSDPMRGISQAALMLDDASRRLDSAIPRSMETRRASLTALHGKLAVMLSTCIEGPRARLCSSKERLLAGSKGITSDAKGSISQLSASLEALSPLSVLSRGYAIARDEHGDIIRIADRLDIGEKATVKVSEGAFECEVTGIIDVGAAQLIDRTEGNDV